MKKLAILAGVLSVAVSSFAGGYVAVEWNSNDVHFLDSNMNSTGSFNSGGQLPNGVATNGGKIYAGFFINDNNVNVFDSLGNFIMNVDLDTGGNLQGMTFWNGLLVVTNSSDLLFFDPTTGVLDHTLAGASSGTIEGLTSDSEGIWLLNDSTLDVINGNTGAYIRSIPNPGSGWGFSGTGLASSGANELTVAGPNGEWAKVSKADGSLFGSGNNGLAMYGLDAFDPVPEPGSMLALGVGIAAIAARRRRK